MRRTQEKFLKQRKKGCLALNFGIVCRRAQFNPLRPEAEKMTASIKEREDKRRYVTVKTTSKTKKLTLENKEETELNQLKETLEAKENEIRSLRKMKLKRTKTVSYLTGTH